MEFGQGFRGKGIFELKTTCPVCRIDQKPNEVFYNGMHLFCMAKMMTKLAYPQFIPDKFVNDLIVEGKAFRKQQKPKAPEVLEAERIINQRSGRSKYENHD